MFKKGIMLLAGLLLGTCFIQAQDFIELKKDNFKPVFEKPETKVVETEGVLSVQSTKDGHRHGIIYTTIKPRTGKVVIRAKGKIGQGEGNARNIYLVAGNSSNPKTLLKGGIAVGWWRFEVHNLRGGYPLQSGKAELSLEGKDQKEIYELTLTIDLENKKFTVAEKDLGELSTDILLPMESIDVVGLCTSSGALAIYTELMVE